MSDPTVLLRLAGTGPADRLRAWVEALGRASTGRRHLHLPDAEPDAEPGDELRQWCAQAGVEIGGASDADVVVVAAAYDLPSPGALHRLVAATAASGEPHQTRVLPWGATADGPDAEPAPTPVVCVAFPAGADQDADPTGVRRLESAAVFTDRRVDGTTAPASASNTVPPYGHPAALPATALHLLLRQAGLPTPELPAGLEDRPFLTVVTRTQGTRLLLLEETLTCLAGQTSRDFEIVLACHRVGVDALAAVREVVAATPGWLRERIRVLEVDRPGRAAPLNDAFDAARGRYVAVLDDDDAVTLDWVAAFAELESRAPGTVLRTVALAQEVHPVPSGPDGGGAVPADDGPARPVWPAAFSMVDHLWDNASPFMTVAMPRGVYADLGRRFDEGLATNEDWAYLMDAAALAGVTSGPAATSVYRLWARTEGSRDIHDADVWRAAREAVLAEVDARVLLLPPGAGADVRRLRSELEEERAEKFRFAGLNEQAASDLVTVNEAVDALRARVAELEERLRRQRERARKRE
ncbi:glycosyltransferase family A protein [Nocardioides zhouii]|uniref:Glycosyltransferase family 2 protein n=1 Tax=Nocardioides zhouii TaxID=1168729 RepID=A0A4Q2T475_9ACTN|nr:glycosyltransferase family A protein [Nocardioides zhouii]RYC11539.1 glycosyltransferase family 2 protein [Nocardioides zhouii]